jgi:hypothetical protein
VENVTVAFFFFGGLGVVINSFPFEFLIERDLKVGKVLWVV